MKRDILIMKHGNVKRGFYLGDDSYELKDKGKRNAQRIGVWLDSSNLIPDYVVYSSANYARVSAEKTCKAAGINLKQVKAKECAYDASQEEILSIIKATPKNIKRILVVGHNPALEEVLSLLSSKRLPKNKKGKVLSPATLIHFRIEREWSSITNKSADLIEIVYPKELPEMFPYPDANGSEKRIRPAYYYSQSGVIPYRIKNSQIEVLLISSKTNKHWVIPKGIHEPGLSARESARVEAYEEAGIEGDILDKEVAQYQYIKWDATCTVSIFLMKVNVLLNEDHWLESNRQRRWATISEATDLIHNPELASIVKLIPDYIGLNAA